MTHPLSSDSDILIVGAGIAGLSCGLLFAQAGYAVTLLEAAPQPGGRARTIQQRFLTDHHLLLDNGPHLIMGAYQSFFKLLQLADVSLESAFYQLPFTWSTNHFHLQLGRGSTISAILQTLWHSHGLTGKEVWALLRLRRILSKKTACSTEDLTVTNWLQRLNMPHRLISQLWRPLCLSALNTDPDEASANCFIQVLRLVFTRGSAGWQMYWARCDLSSLYVQPFIRHITAAGGKVLTGQRVRNIERINTTSGYKLQTQHTLFTCRHVILALPVWQAAKVLTDSGNLQWSSRQSDLKNLFDMSSRPIASVYVIPSSMTAFQADAFLNFPPMYLQHFNGYSIVWLHQQQWRDDFINHRGQFAPMVTAIYSCQIPDNPEAFTRQALEALINHKIDINTIKLMTIYEHQATPAAKVHRPSVNAQLLGKNESLWLCGDYLSSDLPGTLETAAQNAFHITQRILKNYA